MATGPRKAGEFCWINLLTPQPAPAREFFGTLLGWTPEVMPLTDAAGTSTTFKLGTEPVAGMLQITPPMGEVRPHWGTYFTVDDADEAASQAVELGGKQCRRMTDAPGIGRCCGVTSPQGITFYVIEYTA